MDLSNAISKSQLDRLRPRPLVAEFTFADHPGPILLGTIPKDYIVRETVVDIEEVFDSLGITVGDMTAQARLQAISDNNPQNVSRYNVNNVIEYTSETEVYVFFPTGTPTSGRARVIVYLD